MAFTTLERQILKISGTSYKPGSTVAANTTLQAVTLTTIDEVVGPANGIDGSYLNFGELASFRINGTQVLSSVPNFFFTIINTDAGSFRALVFTVGNDTYLLPQANVNVGSITHTTAISTLGSQAITSIAPADFGLNPEHANTFTGNIYMEDRSFGQLNGSSIGSFNIYDQDHIRGNADSQGEETAVANIGVSPDGTIRQNGITHGVEILATILFKDGTTLTDVKGIESIESGAYYESDSFIFDSNALAAAHQTLSTIDHVVSVTTTDHALNWEGLGFNLTAIGSAGPLTPDPAPAAPHNIINGTARADKLVGTAGIDEINGKAGNDTYTGGAGGDAFIYGAETHNGIRETDTITDFQVGIDHVVFDIGAASIQGINTIKGGLQIVFTGEHDRLNVYGANLNSAIDLGIISHDNFLLI